MINRLRGFLCGQDGFYDVASQLFSPLACLVVRGLRYDIKGDNGFQK